MYKRRGLSHIEFVISFVIFIAFIVLAFVFLNPLQNGGRTLRSTLDYSWLEIKENATAPLETYSVVLTGGPVGDISIDISGIPSNFNASVEKSDGTLIQTYRDNRGVHFARPNEDFVKIRYSPVFVNGPILTGTPLADTQYQISSSDSEEPYFERRLVVLNQSYFSNYTGLKKDFNLPNRIDFGFRIIFADNSEIVASKEIPTEAEILSQSDRVAVVRINGQKESAELRVFVW